MWIVLTAAAAVYWWAPVRTTQFLSVEWNSTANSVLGVVIVVYAAFSCTTETSENADRLMMLLATWAAWRLSYL
jgi:hypothetical protein